MCTVYIVSALSLRIFFLTHVSAINREIIFGFVIVRSVVLKCFLLLLLLIEEVTCSSQMEMVIIIKRQCNSSAVFCDLVIAICRLQQSSCVSLSAPF